MAKDEVTEVDPQALADLINKKWGPGTMRFANDPYFNIERIPTGILSLDYELGGGFPRGRHVEIYGGYAVGKTYTVYKTIASAQNLGLPCAFIDVESTFDPDFATLAGVDVDRLAVHRQEHGNRVVDFMETLLRAGKFGVIGLDSISSLLPKSELEADMEAGSMGMEQAKLMSKALRKLTAANQSTVLIYINQLREAVGVMFGKRYTTSGGRAMEFYASTRLDMTKVETLKRPGKVLNAKTGEFDKKDVPYGHRVMVRIDKDKSGGTYAGSMTSFVFLNGHGVDHVEDLIYLGLQTGWVEKKGTKWVADGFEDEAVVGRANFHKWLTEHPDVQVDLRERITEPDPGE